ncbi:MAG: hypothetical protein KDA55_20410, partial [Planctomycetales bacterium]|nr:hypothetical protein [Planctomycetales bacterium]
NSLVEVRNWWDSWIETQPQDRATLRLADLDAKSPAFSKTPGFSYALAFDLAAVLQSTLWPIPLVNKLAVLNHRRSQI